MELNELLFNSQIYSSLVIQSVRCNHLIVNKYKYVIDLVHRMHFAVRLYEHHSQTPGSDHHDR